MLNSLGFAVYLTTFERQWPTLRSLSGTGAPVFLSLHIGEEAGRDYAVKAEKICHTLAGHGFRIIADVSVKTLELFGEADLFRLANRLNIWALRIDYGFGTEYIQNLAQKMPIMLNASTTAREEVEKIHGKEVYAFHNFYPRPETGLDREYLMETTEKLQECGLRVLCFIPGDTEKRGPVYAGLPTLEEHRSVLPSAAFADLVTHFDIHDIFIGDPGLSQKELDRIRLFCESNIISVPAELNCQWESLYGRVFTCRQDSPKWLLRFQESRTYSCQGASVEPRNCVVRSRGAITVDNKNYGRYSGEIQMIRSPLSQDDRVNVIGWVPENAQLLMDCVGRGRKFMLVKP